MMSDSDPSHDEAISQFSSLTGVTTPEVSAGESALLYVNSTLTLHVGKKIP